MATQKEPVWKGSKALTEIPGSPDWNIDENGTSVTLQYEGPYDLIKLDIDAGKIDYGKTVTGLNEKLLIKKIRLVLTGEGDVGRLTLRLDDYTPGAGTVSIGERAGATYEDDWIELEKAIETHPRYEDLSDSEIRDVKKAIDEGTIYNGTALAVELYEKLLRGQTAYTLYAPVIRVTTPYEVAPPNGKAGAIEEPPGDIHPEDWEWRKTAYRRVKPGSLGAWDLVEEWTGAESIDEDIYGDQNGG